MKHKHKWKLYYQGGICPVNHNYEECKCGELRDYLQVGDSKKEFITKTDKKVMLVLKEKVKSWNK